MRKFGTVLIVLLLIPILVIGADERTVAIPSVQRLSINDSITDVQGYNVRGHNYYMIRDLAVELGSHSFNFSLWGDGQVVVADRDSIYENIDHKIENPGGVQYPTEKTMRFQVIENGEKLNHSVDVINISGYNFLKLRDVAAAFGIDVDYDRDDQLAQLYTEKAGTEVVLGNERLLEEYIDLIKDQNVGLVTNQTGVDSKGIRTVDKLYNCKDTNLVAIYSPEHGLDGKSKAGEWVESYTDEELDLPVYSIYGKTREPSQDMLKDVDVLIFDIQDIGSRTYTYVSSMNYCMKAAQKADIPMIVLDRPNPLGDKVEGYMLLDKYKTFVGVDNMPMAHGMTIGELAKYYNRTIHCDLKVIEMKNYRRDMIWQDTGLPFHQTSPNIPNLQSAFNYMATGSGVGTGVVQGLHFGWVGHKDVDGLDLVERLNDQNLPGVEFVRDKRSIGDGVKLVVTDYRSYNPCRTGYVILATINQMVDITIPVEEEEIPMFEKIQGSDKLGLALMAKKSPEEIVEEYQKDIELFKKIREPYLIYK